MCAWPTSGTKMMPPDPLTPESVPPLDGPTRAASVLEVHGLEAAYGGIKALQGVDLTISEGELVVLVGANGAGKSTLLRVISGLVPARRGSVVFQGQDVTRNRPDQLVAMGMMHVPEGRDVLRRMTVEENLRMGAFSRGNARAIVRDLQDLYERFPILSERRRQLAGTLSGGEQQMLAIGRALMARPRLLLLDEPSLGLAPILVTQVFHLVQQLRSQGLTILLVEQNARQALRHADRAYVLRTGRVVLEGTSRKVLEDPSLRQAYLGHRPSVA
jgi:branched-chain amino acid transport system ATP-binding protein